MRHFACGQGWTRQHAAVVGAPGTRDRQENCVTSSLQTSLWQPYPRESYQIANPSAEKRGRGFQPITKGVEFEGQHPIQRRKGMQRPAVQY